MARIDTQPVKGTRDFLPSDMRIRRWLEGHWRAVAEQFGFEEYDACVLESEALYTRKAGDEITAQLYNFLDKGERRVALRPEATPSLARILLGQGSALSLPIRWWTIAQCFRYEQAQRGRKREHYQWNMDVVGLASVAAEVELMSAQGAFLSRVGLHHEDVVFRVSNRQVLQGYLADLGIDGERFAAVCVVIDKRGKVSDETIVEMLAAQGVDAPTAARILSLLDVRGLEQLEQVTGADNPGLRQLRELSELAQAAGIAGHVQIDLSVVRGLSYYTGTVWELFDAAGAVPRAIAGGGRYDRLMETFGGDPTPMVGFGFGDVVITLVLEERGLIPPQARGVDAVIYPMSSKEFPAANRLAAQLRAQGQRIWVDYAERRFKHAIKGAEDLGAAQLYILGGNEVKDGVAVRRTLGSREEVRVPLS